MSTIASTNIKHPSSAVNNMVLSSNGNVTAATKFIGSGLDHIATQSFSSVSSISINNCFSSTYENYRIVIFCTHSIETPLLLRLRSSGVDASSAYFSKLIYSRYDGTGVFGDAVRNNSDNLWIGTGGTSRGLVVDLQRPAIVDSTFFQMVNGDNNAGSSGGGRHSTSASYDGFTIYVTSGTISGNLRVYGYENT